MSKLSGRSFAKRTSKKTRKSTGTTKGLKRKGVSDALEILDDLTGDDPELRKLIDEESLNARIAQLIYASRTDAGLTQQRVAQLVGTTQSVIARLEDADYSGHSLSMLNRIAEALGQRIDVRFVRRK